MPTIEETIQSLIPRLTEEVAAKIRDNALQNLQWDVARKVQEEVGKYIEDVIIPAVRAELADHEAEIKASVLAAIRATFDAVGAALVASATKKLASYEGDKLLTQMLGPLLRGY